MAPRVPHRWRSFFGAWSQETSLVMVLPLQSGTHFTRPVDPIVCGPSKRRCLGRNPTTGVALPTPAQGVMAFKPSATLTSSRSLGGQIGGDRDPILVGQFLHHPLHQRHHGAVP